MNKVQIAKTVVAVVVGAGTVKIVSQIISNNVIPATTLDKVTVAAASLVLGGLLTELSCSFTDTKIDKIVAQVNKIVLK